MQEGTELDFTDVLTTLGAIEEGLGLSCTKSDFVYHLYLDDYLDDKKVLDIVCNQLITIGKAVGYDPEGGSDDSEEFTEDAEEFTEDAEEFTEDAEEIYDALRRRLLGS